jgi:formylglycine-generating enzyme required for sulfatase activity
MSRTIFLTILLILQSIFIATLPADAAGRRVALVIGNAAYTDVGALTNPIIDADAISKALENAGFDDVRHVSNLSADAMRLELKDFSARAADSEIAMIYYAGHGVEVSGQNYLVPVDAKLLRSTDTEFEAIPLSTVRSAVAGATKLRIVVLDACRNNPFKMASNDGKRAATRGLGNIEPGTGEVVAYSAKEGTLAQDGPANSNSPFAAALVKNLSEPGLEIRLLFGKVRDDVISETNNEQDPYTYMSLGGEAIYLKPALGGAQSSKLKPLQTFTDCAKCPQMVVMPAGEFIMGSPDDEPDHEKDESPQHLVKIAKPFAVSKYEVTVGQFAEFLASTDYDVGKLCTQWNGKKYISVQNSNFFKPGFDRTNNHPATCLSWKDAKAYTQWLSKLTGFSYRLLTEAEWEYVARAGTKTAFVTGDILEADKVNFGGKGLQRVGQYQPNAFNLYDTQGNAWEWTEDCYAKTYDDAPADGSAYVVPNCERIYRGGAWANVEKDMRFATRGTNADDKRVNIFGMRLARDSN